MGTSDFLYLSILQWREESSSTDEFIYLFILFHKDAVKWVIRVVQDGFQSGGERRDKRD